MKVIYGIGKLSRDFKNSVLAIGVFDGLHLGHQELIKRTVSKARSLKRAPIVLTFSPHPIHVLRPEEYLPLVVSLPYRLKLLETLGVAKCIVIHFTKPFSKLTPEKFIEHYLVKSLEPKEVFIGDDFRFGYNRRGTLEYFREAGEAHGFKINTVRSIKGKNKKIGSSMIRHLIIEGKLLQAQRLLGRRVSVFGEVMKGDRRGSTLGFPTANIYPSKEVIPPVGVYAVHVRVGQNSYPGMANIGRRPSFKSANSRINIEVHLFDFRKNLYGKEIIVEFIKKIREEKTFCSKEEFIRQLIKDESRAKKIMLTM